MGENIRTKNVLGEEGNSGNTLLHRKQPGGNVHLPPTGIPS